MKMNFGFGGVAVVGGAAKAVGISLLLPLLLLLDDIGFPITIVNAFTITPAGSSSKSSSSSRLFALVFDENGYPSSSSSSSYTLDDSYSSSSPYSLIEYVSDQVKSTASLVRLACAFAPPGHEIHPSDLTTAEIVAIDDHHIELSAVACDSEQCVTLLVPIEFPHACDQTINDGNNNAATTGGTTTMIDCNNNNVGAGGAYATMEECIVDNLEELDLAAMKRIQQQEYEYDHKDDIQQDENVWTNLQNSDPQDVPQWWISADEEHNYLQHNNNNNNNNIQTMMMMVDECRNVKKLLNENEFRQDVVDLATRTCQEMYPMDTFRCSHAAVTRVGPNGLILKANICLDDDDDDTNNTLFLDIPVKFSSLVQTPEELRASVLGTVVAG